MKKLEVRWSDDRGYKVSIKRKDICVLPLIRAIIDPSLEEVAGLDDLSTPDLIEVIETFSDMFVLGLSMENPAQEQFGFVLNPRAFGFAESEHRLAYVMHALLKRFGEAQTHVQNWRKYAGRLRS